MLNSGEGKAEGKEMETSNVNQRLGTLPFFVIVLIEDKSHQLKTFKEKWPLIRVKYKSTVIVRKCFL